MQISVILPVYNEELNIERTLRELREVLQKAKLEFEIIPVDDGSTDCTVQIIKKCAEEGNFIKGIFLAKNCGEALALDAGFRHASGDFIVTMDADGQDDPKDILRLMEKINQGYDFVSGWRRNRKDNFLYRRVPSKVANFLIRKFLAVSSQDMGCSLKIYRRKVIDQIFLYGGMHRFLPVFVERSGSRTAEIEVFHRPRLAGQSKYGLNRMPKVILDLMTVWFIENFSQSPMYLFGGIGIFLVTCSLLMIILYFVMPSFPFLWVALFFFMFGTQFCFIGLIAEVLIRTYYRSQNKLPYIVREIVRSKLE